MTIIQNKMQKKERNRGPKDMTAGVYNRVAYLLEVITNETE